MQAEKCFRCFNVLDKCPKMWSIYFYTAIFILCKVEGRILRPLVRSAGDNSSLTDSNVTSLVTGQLRLRGGKNAEEGNVQIYYGEQWGAICDDEWDIADATVACRQLGFSGGAVSFTADSYYGRLTEDIWLDNMGCTGYESRLADCRHDGWRRHDCTSMEAAGVVCKPNPIAILADAASKSEDPNRRAVSEIFKQKPLRFKLKHGRNEKEGRVEIIHPRKGLICGDKWGVREAMVVCRELGLGYAQQAVQGSQFNPSDELRKPDFVLHNVKCTGDEESLSNCTAVSEKLACEGDWVAGVVCAHQLPDLEIDLELLRDSVYLHDHSLHYLQCAMEENCLASSAQRVMRESAWHYMIRRLLRFSTKVLNIGDADFLPDAAKAHWQWHQCHMHYHSMEVFSHYDIIDPKTGRHIAEGHKASFCLEDTDCGEGVTKKYVCRNHGDQGIAPGCWDTYLHDIDCQWIDITDLDAGTYIFKVAVNPEYKVAEKNFTNNAVVCDLYYTRMQASINNCVFTAP